MCYDVLPWLGACRGSAEVAGWTLDRKIPVPFPAYPHCVWALWWQGGNWRLRTSQCPCQGRLGTLKTPSCPWRGCPAAGQNLETGHLSLYSWISLNVTLNHNQQQQLWLGRTAYVLWCFTMVGKGSIRVMMFYYGWEGQQMCYDVFLWLGRAAYVLWCFTMVGKGSIRVMMFYYCWEGQNMCNDVLLWLARAAYV